MSQELTLFVGMFTTLLAIINPLEALPIFLKLLEGKDEDEHRRVVDRGTGRALPGRQPAVALEDGAIGSVAASESSIATHRSGLRKLHQTPPGPASWVRRVGKTDTRPLWS